MAGSPLANRLLPPVLILTGLLLAYLLLSQLLIALLAPRLLADYFSRRLERPVTIARAGWQPFNGILTLHNGIVGPRRDDPDDRIDPLLSFRTLRARISPGNLWGDGPLFKTLHLTQPFIHIHRDAAGRYNLAPEVFLFGSRLPDPLEIRDGRFFYSDHGLPDQGRYQVEIRQINGHLQPAPPRAANHRVAIDLSGVGPQAAGCRLQGELTPGATADHDHLQLVVNRWPLTNLAPYLEPLLGHTINAGLLTMQAEFRPGPGGKLQIEQQVELAAPSLGAPGDDTVAKPNIALLLALLRGRDEMVRLELPLSIQTRRQDSPYLRALRELLTARASQAAADPWQLLPRGGDKLRAGIGFAAGQSTLSRAAGRRLDQLAGILRQRSLLGLKLTGISDPACDQPPLLTTKREKVAQQRRQVVARLAAQVAAEAEVTVTAAELERLRPAKVTVDPDDLRLLARERQLAAQQRLVMALGLPPAEATERLELGPVRIDDEPTARSNGCGAVTYTLFPF
ncbi:MAG: DUF748 domain-containing protein [Desulfurivibrio sp.]|nr:DUF748 domain-containing protein [Desulfurivibrio sp.]